MQREVPQKEFLAPYGAPNKHVYFHASFWHLMVFIYKVFINDSFNNANSSKNFKFSFHLCFSDCVHSVMSKDGVITSPNYPQKYSNFETCFWKIETTPGSRIQLVS